MKGRRDLSVRPSDPDEAYADDFAMNLLMPQEAMRGFVDAGASFMELMGVFGVEYDVMSRRLSDLGLKVKDKRSYVDRLWSWRHGGVA